MNFDIQYIIKCFAKHRCDYIVVTFFLLAKYIFSFALIDKNLITSVVTCLVTCSVFVASLMACNFHIAQFVPSRPVPSRPVPSRPVPSRPVPSRPVPSRPVPSRPVPSRPVPSRPVPSRPVPSRPVPSRPVLSGVQLRLHNRQVSGESRKEAEAHASQIVTAVVGYFTLYRTRVLRKFTHAISQNIFRFFRNGNEYKRK